jgi:hypothetical protein
MLVVGQLAVPVVLQVPFLVNLTLLAHGVLVPFWIAVRFKYVKSLVAVFAPRVEDTVMLRGVPFGAWFSSASESSLEQLDAANTAAKAVANNVSFFIICVLLLIINNV